MNEKTYRPRTFKSALAAWADAMTTLHAEPTTDNLQTLCTLLDVMDGEMVRTWGADGHEWRRGVFRECRAAARQANALVSARALAGAKARGEAAAAARREKAAADA